ncbi:MAG: hypothetical protein MZW92_23325 [Comamonadaceae bacterium]|nr:hypothetical protein [Comamonadaceae bacterium]
MADAWQSIAQKRRAAAAADAGAQSPGGPRRRACSRCDALGRVRLQPGAEGARRADAHACAGACPGAGSETWPRRRCSVSVITPAIRARGRGERGRRAAAAAGQKLCRTPAPRSTPTPSPLAPSSPWGARFLIAGRAVDRALGAGTGAQPGRQAPAAPVRRRRRHPAPRRRAACARSG